MQDKVQGATARKSSLGLYDVTVGAAARVTARQPVFRAVQRIFRNVSGRFFLTWNGLV